jgi:hypothetical protein
LLGRSQLFSVGGALLAAAVTAPVSVASADTTLATGLPPGVKVSMRGDAVAWSAPAAGGGYRLVIRTNGVARDAAVAPSPRPFDVDLGDDGHGHLIATYSRCSGRRTATPPRGCDVYLYAVAAKRERRVRGLGRGGASDYLPTAARGRIAFARSVRGGQPRLYVRALDGRRLRALPFGRREAGSGPTSLDLGARGLALAWKRVADYGSQQVRFDPLRGRSRVLATYSGGALAGTDIAGVSATRTGVFWGTEGFGESIGISRLYVLRTPNGSPEASDPGVQLTSVSGVGPADAVALSCEPPGPGTTSCSVVLLGASA